ncbi:tyrosine-type recombinase/integrase [uncultured Sphingomonas sp.]|uniref:tyrosine-type recombinase/integrase n=1 Tax=uncultured Sphingomonas sp. TaxID=158754 RepID=UPI0025DE4AF3|nr:tyrosine-type recombinase/integrase [uncultured Sphingomonas sp.]
MYDPGDYPPVVYPSRTGLVLRQMRLDRGKLPPSVLTGTDRLYEADRSDVIWEAPDFAAFMPHASVEIQEAVELASLTGLRRGDLIRLAWLAVGEHAILWKTGKSKGKGTARVPMMGETKALLQRIRDRYAAAMEVKRPDRRKPLPDTVLSNSHWQSWTPSGVGSRFNDAKTASKVERNCHDLRGTFATRCMLAGLNDQEIADILGWKTVKVAAIRVKYVDQTRVVIELGTGIAAAKV